MSNTQLKELIIYIAQQCSGDSNFGAKKLNKLLFFADYFFYLRTGETITGAKYIHKRYGPVPIQIDTLKGELQKAGDATVATIESGGYTQERLVALREANLKQLDGNKVAFVQKVIDLFCTPGASWNGKSISDLSHDVIAWLVTNEREEIRPSLFLFGRTQDQHTHTEQDIARATALDSRYAPAYAEA